jgi:hypothetical protein
LQASGKEIKNKICTFIASKPDHMQYLFVILLLFISSSEILAQALFGTALIKGSVTLQIEETYEEYCQNILSEKRETKESYSTQLTGQVYLDKFTINLIRKYPTPAGIPGRKISLDNFTETLPKGMDFFNMGNYQVPRFPVSGRYEEKRYGKDPCRQETECDPEYKAVLNYRETCEGAVSHHGHPGSNFRVSVEGVDKCSRYLFLSFNSAGTFVENGTAETCFIHGKSSTLRPDGLYNDCKWKWEENESKVMLNADIMNESLSVSPSMKNDGTWYGTDGLYRRNEQTDEGDGVTTTVHEEMMLMKIDTGAIFRYVLQRPETQTYTTSGYHNSTSNDGRRKIIHNTRYSATLTFGKKPPFTIAAENEEEYKSWLPGHPDYPGSSKPLTIKARFDDSNQQDSIRFELFNLSHLPGICTNYPILPENPPKEPGDVFFAPQDKQTDPNIRILDDSTAITTDLVNEAAVVVLSRDFGGHARIRATGMRSGDMAECTDEDKESLSVPYDLNGNLIAEKWEKDMGIEGADKLEDKDNLPKGHGREGDGLTVFEEYRGFVCEKDLEASCDGSHTLRTGKHVRTSPLGRDVFISDEDGLFAKYMAPGNPAECHWHYVTRDQMKLPPPDQVSKVIKANENDYPDAKDTSPGANTIRTELDAANSLMNDWAKKEFRRINTNSPDKFKINPQFGMHLLTSPSATTEGGVTICPDPKSAQSPLRYTHLVALPQFEVFKKRQLGAITGLLANSGHPELKTMYPPDVQEKVVQTAYEAMVPHEVGHGLGINHHAKGALTVVSKNTKEKIVLGNKVNGYDIEESKGQCNELYYKDLKEYLITSANFAFMSFGVTDCCMRYTVEREVDFIEKKVLLPSVKYCRKGQKFINGNGKQTDADDCFSQILIKCIN